MNNQLGLMKKLRMVAASVKRAAQEIIDWRKDCGDDADTVLEALGSAEVHEILVNLQTIVENLTPPETSGTVGRRHSVRPLAVIKWNIGTVEGGADDDAAVQLHLDLKKLASILSAINLTNRNLRDHWNEVAGAKPEERPAVIQRLLDSANDTVSSESYGLLNLQVVPPAAGLPSAF